jgi:hypothetical protein
VLLYEGATEAGKMQHWNDNLQLVNSTTGGNIELYTQGSSNPRFVAKSTGEIGIGIGNPVYKLHVLSSGTNARTAYFYNQGTASTKYALYAESDNAGEGNKYGVYGKAIASPTQTSDDKIYGVRGSATTDGSSGTLYGVYGSVDFNGAPGSSALYGLSSGVNHFALYANGNAYFEDDVRIGHTDDIAGYKVSVDGKILAEEIKVKMSENWPDYVFEADYALMPLEELKAKLQHQKHLPGVPSAYEVENDGIELGKMNKILLEKIEELTLYLLQKDEEINALKVRVEQLERN